MEQVYEILIQLTHEITDLKQEIVELRKENEYLKVVAESMNPVISNEKRQHAMKKLSDYEMEEERRQALQTESYESLPGNLIK